MMKIYGDWIDSPSSSWRIAVEIGIKTRLA